VRVVDLELVGELGGAAAAPAAELAVENIAEAVAGATRSAARGTRPAGPAAEGPGPAIVNGQRPTDLGDRQFRGVSSAPKGAIGLYRPHKPPFDETPKS
jgi:hypothetical protein